MQQNLYGSQRNLKFTDVWKRAEDFVAEYQDNGIPPVIASNTCTTLFYLLYARYGNSTIASSDVNQFKYKLFSIIYMYGGSWEKRYAVQQELRKLDIEELQKSSTAIYNHSFNPSTEPSTQALEELPTINDQNVTKHKRSLTDAYALLLSLLETDVTEEFIAKFKKLFLTVVSPELPLWYITELEGGNEND